MQFDVHTPRKSFRLADTFDFRTYTAQQMAGLFRRVPALELVAVTTSLTISTTRSGSMRRPKTWSTCCVGKNLRKWGGAGILAPYNRLTGPSNSDGESPRFPVRGRSNLTT